MLHLFHCILLFPPHPLSASKWRGSVECYTASPDEDSAGIETSALFHTENADGTKEIFCIWIPVHIFHNLASVWPWEPTGFQQFLKLRCENIKQYKIHFTLLKVVEF